MNTINIILYKSTESNFRWWIVWTEFNFSTCHDSTKIDKENINRKRVKTHFFPRWKRFSFEHETCLFQKKVTWKLATHCEGIDPLSRHFSKKKMTERNKYWKNLKFASSQFFFCFICFWTTLLRFYRLVIITEVITGKPIYWSSGKWSKYLGNLTGNFLTFTVFFLFWLFFIFEKIYVAIWFFFKCQVVLVQGFFFKYRIM